MRTLAERLPKPTALLMFEAAARHGSFTLAARELGVTQVAVSRQVRQLEEQLNLVLFQRLHRGLSITPEGSRLYRTVTMAFEHIAATADGLRPERQMSEISVGVTLAIATYWLLPRLQDWYAKHPGIDVHLLTTDHHFSEIANEVDAALVFDIESWPGFDPTFLCASEVFPICSPDYLEEGQMLSSVEAVLQYTLLMMDDDRPTRIDWPVWLSQMGLGGRRGRRSVRINSIPLLLQAACAGQGVALGWTLLADDLLEKGAIIRAVDATFKTDQNYYFLLNKENESEALLLFRDWILSHFA
jgi:DNA-binding transcriptional LysR family regulator